MLPKWATNSILKPGPGKYTNTPEISLESPIKWSPLHKHGLQAKKTINYF